MEPCGICEEVEQDMNTKCPFGHMVCQECYKKISECPYCRCNYILTCGCDNDNHHDNEIELPPEAIYLDCYRILDLIDDVEIDKLAGHGYMQIKNWVVVTPNRSVSALYAECLYDSMLYFNPFSSDGLDGFDVFFGSKDKLHKCLPKLVKIYLEYIPKSEKYKWLIRLNYCYVRLLICLTLGKHVKYCLCETDECVKYDDFCNCVGDEYVLWAVTKYADELFEKRMLKSFEKIILCDQKRWNLFQNDGFLEDTDFLFLDDLELLKRSKDVTLSRWQKLRCANLCPCDWFMKFR